MIVKVLEDIVANLFSERFLDEIFKPQELCSRKAIKTIFERLAHTSIMRLNQNSMDKVYSDVINKKFFVILFIYSF